MFVFISDQHKTRIVYVCLFPISNPPPLSSWLTRLFELPSLSAVKKSDFFKQKDPLEAPSFCFEMLLVFVQGRGSGQFAKGLLSSKSSEDFR